MPLLLAKDDFDAIPPIIVLKGELNKSMITNKIFLHPSLNLNTKNQIIKKIKINHVVFGSQNLHYLMDIYGAYINGKQFRNEYLDLDEVE